MKRAFTLWVLNELKGSLLQVSIFYLILLLYYPFTSKIICWDCKLFEVLIPKNPITCKCQQLYFKITTNVNK